jgi:hypothetical protein
VRAVDYVVGLEVVEGVVTLLHRRLELVDRTDTDA